MISQSGDLSGFRGIIYGSVFGATVTSIIFVLMRRSKISKPLQEGDDACLSLFYDKMPGPNGIGFPTLHACSESTTSSLITVQPEYRKLPSELYHHVVEKLPIVCVDVICRRRSDNKIVLFYRRDPPAANIWWWPGGRMFRGETFFTAALRKLSEEMGISGDKFQAKAVIGVWNTFFPDSSFDKDRAPGREGTQTVNIVVLCEMDEEFQPQSAQDAHRNITAQEHWAVLHEKWVTVDEALVDGAYDKYVGCNLKLARSNGLL